MFYLRIEVFMKTIVNIAINKNELYKIRERKICMVKIYFTIQNKQSERG